MSKGVLGNEAHKDRFERSKAFSDYLGFHIRATFFLLIGMFALVIPASALLAEANGGPAYRVSEHLLEISVMLFCFSLSANMLFHIFGVGRSFLRVKVSMRFIRLLIYPVYWMLTLGALAAISYYGAFQLARTLGVDIAQIECDMNNYLNQTNYPFTPSQPERCQ